MNKLTILAFIALFAVASADLEVFYKSFNSNDFKDLDGWTAVGGSRADLFNVCSNIRILGGDGVFGKNAALVKHFKLPPHHTLQIKVQFWKIDSWDNEQFFVWVDDQMLYDKRFTYASGEQLCGRGHAQWNEEKVNLDIKVKHTAATAVVVFTSSLDQHPDDESWGIRDFELYIDKCPEKCDTCAQGESEAACSAWGIHKWFWTDMEKMGGEGWSVEGANADTSVCAGVSLFGGVAKFGKGALIKNRIQVPPHYRLKIKMLLAKIDSWDGEKAFLKVDGQEVWTRSFVYHQGYWAPLCGQIIDAWRELFVRVEVDIAHTKPDAFVELTSSLDEVAGNESWGIRDFFVYFASCAKDCGECTGPLPADCSKCQNNFFLQDGKCQALAKFILLEQSFFEPKFSGLNGWVIKGNAGGRTHSECDGKTLVGGFNVFGVGAAAEKTFKLPGHKRIRLQVQLWKIDSWDDEWFIVKADGTEVWKKQIGFGSGGKPMCGQGHANWNELILDVDEIFAHTGDQITILITSTVNQAADDESWGFREFRMFYEAKEECAVFYSECGYKGASFEFCGESSDFRKDSVPPTIRSIKVPPQSRVTLFEKTEFGGRKVTYSESQECIKAFEFSLLQMSGHVEGEWIEVNDNALNGNLRRQI